MGRIAWQADAASRKAAVDRLRNSKFGAVPLALALARCDDAAWRTQLAYDLADMGKNGRAAAPVLVKLLDDPLRWHAASVALAGISPDQHFANVLVALEKFDRDAAGRFPFAPEIRVNPARLAAVLLQETRSPKLQVRGLQGLAVLYPYLANDLRLQVVRASPQLKKMLDANAKQLGAKDVELRRASIRAVVALKRLLQEVAARPDHDENGLVDLLHQQVDAVLLAARSDSDLQVRRLARQAQMRELFRPEIQLPRRVEAAA